MHGPQHQVLERGLRPLRKRRRRGLLLHNPSHQQQLDLDHLHRQRLGLQLFVLGLRHLRGPWTTLLRRQQVRRRCLLLQRNVRGGRERLRVFADWDRRQRRKQPRHVQRGEVQRLRRFRSSLLRNLVRRRSRMSQQRLLVMR